MMLYGNRCVGIALLLPAEKGNMTNCQKMGSGKGFDDMFRGLPEVAGDKSEI